MHDWRETALLTHGRLKYWTTSYTQRCILAWGGLKQTSGSNRCVDAGAHQEHAPQIRVASDRSLAKKTDVRAMHLLSKNISCYSTWYCWARPPSPARRARREVGAGAAGLPV